MPALIDHRHAGPRQATALASLDAEETSREAIERLLHVPQDSFDVAVRHQLPAELDQTVTQVRQLREQAQRLEAAAAEVTARPPTSCATAT